jgi:hypothetical protein
MDNTENWIVLEAGSFGGGSSSFKYHIPKWDTLTMPREFGGLGVISRRMNDCLLTKWI